MFWAASVLKGYSIAATDGDIGEVSDMLFDDVTWKLRWLVADTGKWLPGRLVLLHPSVLGLPDANSRSIAVKLTKAKVKDSPNIQQDLPVSRQMEQGVYAYYGWDPYWGGGAFGMDSLAMPFGSGAGYVNRAIAEQDAALLEPHEGDPHLRSIGASKGDHIHATDGDIGHISDFLVDDETWKVSYLVIDTRNWWPGKHVLMSPAAVAEIDWVTRQFRLNVTRDKVRSSPEYDPSEVVKDLYEESLRKHYDWPGSGI
jgi:hypothetical protein